MTQTMQDRIETAIVAVIETVPNVAAVFTREWANTGTIYAQIDFTNLLVIQFSFQADYATFDVSGPSIETFAPKPPVGRFESTKGSHVKYDEEAIGGHNPKVGVYVAYQPRADFHTPMPAFLDFVGEALLRAAAPPCTPHVAADHRRQP